MNHDTEDGAVFLLDRLTLSALLYQGDDSEADALRQNFDLFWRDIGDDMRLCRGIIEAAVIHLAVLNAEIHGGVDAAIDIIEANLNRYLQRD